MAKERIGVEMGVLELLGVVFLGLAITVAVGLPGGYLLYRIVKRKIDASYDAGTSEALECTPP